MPSNNTKTSSGNILLVANYPSSTGYAWWLMENFWVQIANRLHPKGRSCYLIYPEIHKLPGSLSAAPIEILECDFSDRSYQGRRRFTHIIRKYGITSLYLTDQPYFDLYYAYLRFLGVTNIIIHDHTPGDRPPVTGLKGAAKSIKNQVRAPCADHVLCVSELIRQRAIQNARFPAEKCLAVTNGIHPISCEKPQRFYAHETFGIPRDAIIVVTVARANPYKRVDFIIECAQRVLHDNNPANIYFLYCGDGPALPDLRLAAVEFGIQDRFIFAGKRDDVHKILCSCDIAMHAAAGEGFSLSILEYMSAGLSTLVPDTPTVSQAITDNVTGLIYRAGDMDHAASQLRRLSSDPVLRNRLGQHAKEIVDRDYHIERCNRRFVEVIDAVLLTE